MAVTDCLSRDGTLRAQRCSAASQCTSQGRLLRRCTNLALPWTARPIRFSALQLAHLLLKQVLRRSSMTQTPTSNPRPVSRSEVIDAAARVITKRGDHRMRWAAIAYEAGNSQAVMASQWFEDL